MEKIKGFITRNGFTRSNDFHKSLLKVFQGEFMGRKIMKQLDIINGTMARNYRFNPYPLPNEKNLCQIGHFIENNIDKGTIDVSMFLIGKQIIDFLSMPGNYSPILGGIPFLLRAGEGKQEIFIDGIITKQEKTVVPVIDTGQIYWMGTQENLLIHLTIVDVLILAEEVKEEKIKLVYKRHKKLILY